MEEERETEIHSVEDAMRSPEGLLLAGDETLDRNIARAEQVSSDYFLVRLGSGRWGGLTRAELMKLREGGEGDRPLGGCVSPIAKPYLYPDQSVDSALRVLHQRPMLPVLHRADPGHLVGMLALEDVLRLYRTDPPVDAIE
jgi:CBS domain-containing protein